MTDMLTDALEALADRPCGCPTIRYCVHQNSPTCVARVLREDQRTHDDETHYAALNFAAAVVDWSGADGFTRGMLPSF